MKKFLALPCLLFMGLTLQAQTFTSFKGENGKYGYKDSLQAIVIQPTYDFVQNFSENIGIVYQNKKFGAIDSKGNEVIAIKYEDARNGFHEGLAGFKLNDKWGFINPRGEEIIPFNYSRVNDFSENIAFASEGYQQEFFIDKKGNKLFSVSQYQEKKNVEYGLIMVRKDKKWGCLDKTGKEVIPIIYDDLIIREGGFTSVEQDGKWGGIDNNYNLTVPLLYENAMSFKEGLSAVKLNGKWGFIDQTAKVIIPFQYDTWWGGFKNGLATMEMNGEKFEIDKAGNRKGAPAIAKKVAVNTNPALVKKQVNQFPLTDTVFPTKGIGFGFPKGYKSSHRNSDSRMIFYKADSNIIISVYNTSGFKIENIVADWEPQGRTAGKDGWYKNMGKIAKMEYQHSKPVFTSDYLYPFTYGGGDFIWVQLMTTIKSTGVKEFEAVKASITLKPMPLITQEVIPGAFTMGVPAYLKPAAGNLYGNISIFTDSYNFLYFKQDANSNATNSLNAAFQLQQFKTRVGFKALGIIGYSSPSKIAFNGFYGLEPDALNPSEKTYEAYAFFSNPGMGREIYMVHYRLGKGIPKDFEADIKELLKTIKLKK